MRRHPAPIATAPSVLTLRVDAAEVEKGLAKLEGLVKRRKLPLPWLRPKDKIKQLRVLRG